MVGRAACWCARSERGTVIGAGAVAAAIGYLWLVIDHGSVGSVVAANVPLGFGIGLAFAALVNLVAASVGEHRTAGFVAMTLVCRITGSALGAQVAAAVVIGAGIVAPGFPAESGFTEAFVLGLAAVLVALGASVAIPGRAADPFLGNAPQTSTVAGS